jgi:hypothetical protein
MNRKPVARVNSRQDADGRTAARGAINGVAETA